MIFEPQQYTFIFHDALYSLAAGFAAGFINRVLSVFVHKGRIKLFVKDLFMAWVFAAVVFSYSVSFANYNVLRWYNVAVAGAGFVLFTPFITAAGSVLMGVAAATIKCTGRAVGRKSAGVMKRIINKKREKHQKITQKNVEDTLKDVQVMLYN